MSNSTDKEQVMTSQLYDGPIFSTKINRFDDEFIEEYFTDEGKQAIQAYLATHRDAAVREAEDRLLDSLAITVDHLYNPSPSDIELDERLDQPSDVVYLHRVKEEISKARAPKQQTNQKERS